MLPLRRQNVFVMLALALFMGCSTNEFKPEELPVRLETVREYPGYAFAGDLDGDGSDEIIWTVQSLDLVGAIRHLGYVRMDALDGKIIEQVNYPSFILARALHFLDYDHDGKKEILVPYLINDSLFVSIVNAAGRKLFSFFLINGTPRKEDDGYIAWDPNIIYFHLADIDGYRQEELVTVVNTEYARLPRGVLVHTIPEGRLMGKAIVGAALHGNGFFDDFDRDNRIDFIVGTSAASNGAVAGGFDDQHAYLINFSLAPSPHVAWSKEMAERWNGSTLHYLDFDGDGKKELLCFIGGTPTQKAQLELLEPGTWQTKRQRVFNEPFNAATVIDLDRDLKPEIVVSSAVNEFLVLNGQFEIKLRRQNMPSAHILRTLPDLDGDGVEDLFIVGTSRGFWLTPQLEIKAVVPTFDHIRTVQTGIGKKPYVLTTYRDRSTAKVSSLLLHQQENRFYLWYRYGPTTLKTFGAGLALALVLMTVVSRRRMRRQSAIQTFITDTDSRALLMLDAKGKIVSANAQWRQMIPMNNEEGQRAPFTKAVAVPELIAFISQALTPPERRHETTLLFTSHGRQIRTLVVVEPISIAKERGSHWLVSVSDRAGEAEAQQSQTWSLMAERVAHDLKSPLTSILLTLQRLQREYHSHSPNHAASYDAYAANIIERIEALRRITRNFLKLVDVDELHLVETDLNGFLQQAAKTISANLPLDIQCELKPSAELCCAQMDHEQMQVVLENLVANAINAMPEGGKITLAVSLARNLHLPNANGNACDYAVLEVQDTGIGIPASARERIFEPKFTTSENGTGLGLAMVKKIVAAHNGHVEFESEEGTGTVFSVYLPAA
jgi:signal transduction histidine kinase